MSLADVIMLSRLLRQMFTRVMLRCDTAGAPHASVPFRVISRMHDARATLLMPLWRFYARFMRHAALCLDAMLSPQRDFSCHARYARRRDAILLTLRHARRVYGFSTRRAAAHIILRRG